MSANYALEEKVSCRLAMGGDNGNRHNLDINIRVSGKIRPLVWPGNLVDPIAQFWRTCAIDKVCVCPLSKYAEFCRVASGSFGNRWLRTFLVIFLSGGTPETRSAIDLYRAKLLDKKNVDAVPPQWLRYLFLCIFFSASGIYIFASSAIPDVVCVKTAGALMFNVTMVTASPFIIVCPLWVAIRSIP
ncbi:hypothetical protein [Pararobbsia silviterrae]|uniref:hypothetical protein n=1 Tax=Pararobbsia silviterrae TaxID=1792498 RepID=UPI0011C3BA61|nr:hypothetical protein [Pararobbsia silviterrae]